MGTLDFCNYIYGCSINILQQPSGKCNKMVQLC